MAGDDADALRALARTDDLASLTTFNTHTMKGVESLQPLRECTRLERFVVGGGRIPDLSPLTALPALREIQIDDATVPSLVPLAAMPALRKLSLGKRYAELLEPVDLDIDELWLTSPVTRDLSCLEGSRIRSLAIGIGRRYASFGDGQTLPSIEGLEALGVTSRTLADFRGLSAATELRRLVCAPNKKHRSLDGVETFTRLEVLTCPSGRVTELSPLADLPLRSLCLENNRKLRDVSTLAEVQTLRYLDLGGTKVASVEPLGALPLEILVLDGTEVEDLTPLEGMTSLRRLSLRKTRVDDIELLASLPHLTHLDIGQTDIDALEVLLAHPALKAVGLGRSALADDDAAQAELAEHLNARGGKPYVGSLHWTLWADEPPDRGR